MDEVRCRHMAFLATSLVFIGNAIAEPLMTAGDAAIASAAFSTLFVVLLFPTNFTNDRYAGSFMRESYEVSYFRMFRGVAWRAENLYVRWFCAEFRMVGITLAMVGMKMLDRSTFLTSPCFPLARCYRSPYVSWAANASSPFVMIGAPRDDG